MTVLEVIQRSAEFMERKGVDSARLAAELMLAQVLRLPRLQLYLNFERALPEPELARMREMVQRRSRREPLQHILGTVSFCGLELEVNASVLIPRPETEILAEKAWTLAKGMSAAPAVLDFGTGSGCLAIAVAAKAPAAQVSALDISPTALAVARRNAVKHLSEGRVTYYESDGFTAVPGGLRFDIIVTNPPYIAAAEIETLQPEVKDFDPRLALDGGADGLDFYRRLAAEAPARMVPGGHLLAEFGNGQAPALEALFNTPRWRVVEIIPDLSRRLRHLHAVAAG